MEKERKFMFDVNIFDAPEKEEEIVEDLPPPPPTFSEDELAAAKDMAFEQGRQQGRREEKESREQYIAQSLEEIAKSFSHLFASESLREAIFEKESLKLTLAALDLLHPLLAEKLGPEEVYKTIEQTLSSHRKTKEIAIQVPQGMKAEIDALIARLREGEHDEVQWRVVESTDMTDGNCLLEWSDGGAVRDSTKTARDIRRQIEQLFGESVPRLDNATISEIGDSDVRLQENNESGDTAAADIPSPAERKDE